MTRLTDPFASAFSVLLIAASLLSPLGHAEEEFDWAAEAERRAHVAGTGIIGKPLEPITLKEINGQPLALSEHLGKRPIYLKFWATWCSTCREQMPHFEKIAKQYANKMAVIAVNTGINDDIDDVKNYLDTIKLTMPVVRDDGRLANALELTVTPQHVLIDKQGHVVWLGHKDDAQFLAVLEQVANNRYTPKVANSSKPSHSIQVKVDKNHLAKPFTLTTVQEKTITLPIAGPKNTYIWFNSPWCEWYLADSKPATSAACTALRKIASNRADLGHWVAISLDVWANKTDVIGYLEQHQLTIPTVLENSKTIFSSFGIRDLPSLVVLKPDGTIVQTRTFGSAKEVEEFFTLTLN